VLLALGPRAAAAPLGSSFEPFFERGLMWQKNAATGADPKSAKGPLAEAVATLADLNAPERAQLASVDRERFDALVAWTDGAPLVARRTLGRGEAWIVTLPFGVDTSDLPLRPGFLPLLDAWVDAARVRVSDRRTEVGEPWVFVSGGKSVEVRGPAPSSAPVRVQREGTLVRAIPERVGSYDVTFAPSAGGTPARKEQRVATAIAGELDLRPRAVAEAVSQARLGDTKATVDVSWIVALVLLGLTGAELVVRAVYGRRREA
jgi:hypothetical protein